MSLKDFVETPRMRELFKDYATKIKLSDEQKEAPCVAPSCGHSHALVGTAFDYLARFRLAHEITREMGHTDVELWDMGWVAEGAVLMMGDDPRYRSHQPKFQKLIAQARDMVEAYVSGEENLLPRVAKIAQWLGRVDTVYRVGYFDPNFTLDDEVTADLLRLSSYFEPLRYMMPERRCILNPQFALRDLVDGADSDIVIDNRIIDIKTTQDMSVSLSHLRQLAGYAALQAMGGIQLNDTEVHTEQPVEVSLYFSRYGQMVDIRIEDLFPRDSFSRFVEAFDFEIRSPQAAAVMRA